MGEQKNTVTINGKVYNALSGDLISDAPRSYQPINDFLSAPKPAVKQSKGSRSTHHLAHHKPQKAVTLKRGGKHVRQTVLNSHALSLPIKSDEPVTAEASTLLMPASNRHERAKSVPRSKSISRFNITTTITTHQPLEVKKAPPEVPAHHPPLPKAGFSSETDLFNRALSNATSHKQKPIKLSKRKHRVAKRLGMSAKTANVIAIVFVSLSVAGFAIYQSASNISMHYASAQSGLTAASLPSYRPPGFTLSRNIQSAPGQIVIQFHSNSDDRAFTVTQVSSNWNSQTLAESYLSGKQSQRYQQPSGKIIYIYDGSNATWVDGGIWYRIEGKSMLTNDQLLNFADSF